MNVPTTPIFNNQQSRRSEVNVAGAWKVRGDEKYLIQRCVSTIQVLVAHDFAFTACKIYCEKEGREIKQKLLAEGSPDVFAFSTTSAQHKEWRFRRKIPHTSGRPETRKKIWIRAVFMDNNTQIHSVRSQPFYACSKPDNNATYERNDLPAPSSEQEYGGRTTQTITPFTGGASMQQEVLQHQSMQQLFHQHHIVDVIQPFQQQSHGSMMPRANSMSFSPQMQPVHKESHLSPAPSGFASLLAGPPERKRTSISIVNSPSLESVTATPQSNAIYASTRVSQTNVVTPSPMSTSSSSQVTSFEHHYPRSTFGGTPTPSFAGMQLQPLPSLQALSLVPHRNHRESASFVSSQPQTFSSLSPVPHFSPSISQNSTGVHIDSIYPNAGSKAGGELVEVMGSFIPEQNPQVFFSHLPSRVVQVSQEKLLVKTPSRFLAGTVPVKVVHGSHECPAGAEYHYW